VISQNGDPVGVLLVDVVEHRVLSAVISD